MIRIDSNLRVTIPLKMKMQSRYMIKRENLMKKL